MIKIKSIFFIQQYLVDNNAVEKAVKIIIILQITKQKLKVTTKSTKQRYKNGLESITKIFQKMKSQTKKKIIYEKLILTKININFIINCAKELENVWIRR